MSKSRWTRRILALDPVRDHAEIYRISAGAPPPPADLDPSWRRPTPTGSAPDQL